MSAAKMSSTLGKEGKTRALAREVEEDGGAITGEEATGEDGADGRGGPRPLHFGWVVVDIDKVWRHPPGQILLPNRSRYATNSGSAERSLSARKWPFMC